MPFLKISRSLISAIVCLPAVAALGLLVALAPVPGDEAFAASKNVGGKRTYSVGSKKHSYSSKHHGSHHRNYSHSGKHYGSSRYGYHNYRSGSTTLSTSRSGVTLGGARPLPSSKRIYYGKHHDHAKYRYGDHHRSYSYGKYPRYYVYYGHPDYQRNIVGGSLVISVNNDRTAGYADDAVSPIGADTGGNVLLEAPCEAGEYCTLRLGPYTNSPKIITLNKSGSTLGETTK